MRRQNDRVAWLGLMLYLVAGLLMGCGGSQYKPAMTDPETPPVSNSISGTVTYRAASVAGATVTLWLTNHNLVVSKTFTDANGNYSFSGLSTSGNVPADYQIWVNKAGFGFYPVLTSLNPDGTVFQGRRLLGFVPSQYY